MNNTQTELHSIDPAQKCSFRIEDDVLYVSWKRFGDAGNSAFHLGALSPEISFHETFQGSIAWPSQVMVFGLFMLGLTFFTDLDAHEKSAWFIIGGAVTMIGGLIMALRMRKSRASWIMKMDGTYAAGINHALFDEKEIELFKKCLSKSIKSEKSDDNTSS